MTLILFIPHSQGFILVGDRQNSYLAIDVREKWDGYKEEVSKLHIRKDIGLGIGCAGNTKIYQTFYDRLNADPDITSENFLKKIKTLFYGVCDEIAKPLSFTMTNLLPEVEMIIIKVEEERKIRAFHFNVVHREIDANRIYAIPETNREVKEYLNPNFNARSLSEKDAISLGEVILRQMAFSNALIGPPEYHGYDIMTMTRDGELSLINKERTVEKLTSSEVFSRYRKIKIEEEE